MRVFVFPSGLGTIVDYRGNDVFVQYDSGRRSEWIDELSARPATDEDECRELKFGFMNRSSQ